MEKPAETHKADRRILSYLGQGWSYEQVLIIEPHLSYLDIFEAAGRFLVPFDSDSNDPDSELFEKLRRWRLSKAREQGIPPFVVFWDQHLRDIARRRPTTLEDLLNCNGVGPARLQAHGGEILSIIESSDPKQAEDCLPAGSRAVLLMISRGYTYRQITNAYPHMTFRDIFDGIEEALQATADNVRLAS